MNPQNNKTLDDMLGTTIYTKEGTVSTLKVGALGLGLFSITKTYEAAPDENGEASVSIMMLSDHEIEELYHLVMERKG